MKFKQRFYPLLSNSPLSLAVLIEKTGVPLLLPTYHTVSDRPLKHIQHHYPIKNVKQFTTDLEYLLNHFEPVSIEDILKHLTGEKRITKPSFHLSFDDGMRDCIETIAPILLKKGVTASFYINSDFVDNQHLFYRHKVSLLLDKVKTLPQTPTNITKQAISEQLLKMDGFWKKDFETSLKAIKFNERDILDVVAAPIEVSFKRFLKMERPYMTLAEIKELHQKGFHIGAHSVSHPNYQDISTAERIAQTVNSIDFVKKHFPAKVTTFAFPYSSIGIPKSFFDILNQHVDISFGTSGLKLDSVENHLHRFPMEGANFSPERMIKGEYNAFLLKKMAGKHIFKRL